MIKHIKHAAWQAAIAFDQLINCIVWIRGDGFGYADETLSARAWRLRGQSTAYLWINRLFWWQENHCLESYDAEINRRQMPVEYRS